MASYLITLLSSSVLAKEINNSPNVSNENFTQRVNFCGVVKDVVPINKFNGVAVNASSDPKYILTVLVISAPKETYTKYTIGSKHSFAIHSPSLTLGVSSENAKGNNYNFTLAFGLEGGPRYIDFKAKAVNKCNAD